MKIDINEYLELRDYKKIVDECFDVEECPKGRLFTRGFICLHCGSGNPEEECLGLSYDEMKERQKEKNDVLSVDEKTKIISKEAFVAGKMFGIAIERNESEELPYITFEDWYQKELNKIRFY